MVVNGVQGGGGVCVFEIKVTRKCGEENQIEATLRKAIRYTGKINHLLRAKCSHSDGAI